MTSLPALSVVVPNYNHGQYLPNCLEALLNQSVPPAEVIVIDDASTDNSLQVLDGFAQRYPALRVYRNEQNQGVVYNLNRGMDLARGDYLFFPAADDEVKPGLFEKSLTLLAKHPDAALSCTVSEWHDMRSGLSWHMSSGIADRPCYLSPDELVQLGQQGKFMIVSASAIMRKKPLVEIGRFIPELRWHCDWFATFATALRYGMCFVPEVLSDFYLHPTSYYNRGRKKKEHLEVLTRILDRLSSPACADIAPRIRDSVALALFGWPILRLCAQRPAYRQFLTPQLFYHASRRSTELVGKKILPNFLARIALRLLYRHKASG
jgi:glycosyltransferase involved in cell wall biosynthesis